MNGLRGDLSIAMYDDGIDILDRNGLLYLLCGFRLRKLPPTFHCFDRYEPWEYKRVASVFAEETETGLEFFRTLGGSVWHRI